MMARITAPAASRQPPATDAELDDVDDRSLTIKRAHTSVSTHGVHKPAGVPSSAFEAGVIAKRENAPRKAYQAADVDTLVIDKAVPLPAVTHSRKSKWPALIARMAPGDSVELTEGQAKSLVKRAAESGKKVTMRTTTPGRARVWLIGDRTPRKDAAQ